jgi:hypothetical protein
MFSHEKSLAGLFPHLGLHMQGSSKMTSAIAPQSIPTDAEHIKSDARMSNSWVSFPYSRVGSQHSINRALSGPTPRGWSLLSQPVTFCHSGGMLRLLPAYGAIIVGLSACTLTPQRYSAPSHAQPVPPHAQTAGNSPRILTTPQPKAANAASSTPDIAPEPDRSFPVETTNLNPTPIGIIGRSQESVRELLGSPSARTSHGASQTWTYSGPYCALEISFYFDLARNDFYALSERSIRASTQSGSKLSCSSDGGVRHAS